LRAVKVIVFLKSVRNRVFDFGLTDDKDLLGAA